MEMVGNLQNVCHQLVYLEIRSGKEQYALAEFFTIPNRLLGSDFVFILFAMRQLLGITGLP